MTNKENADSAQRAEDEQLQADLLKNDRDEEREWGIKTDLAAFGRKRIVVPDRW